MPWKECHVMDERVRFVARLLDDERMTTCPLTLRSDASRMPVPSRTSDTSRIQAQRSRPGIRSTRPGTTDDGGLCSPTTHHCANRGARRRHWPPHVVTRWITLTSQNVNKSTADTAHGRAKGMDRANVFP